MMDDRDVERIALSVMTAHECHTVVLYGSRARGSADAHSDLDLLCVRQAGPMVRDARLVEGVYLDAFIYPEASIATPDAEMLRLLGGRVLREREGFGTALLAKVQALYDAGPAPMTDDHRQMLVVWAHKMLDRFAGQSGVEADYRRSQLLLQSLDDYFTLRGRWYRGPKEGFAWLRQHDAPTYQLLERTAGAGASDADFAELVRAVYGVNPA